MNGRNTHKWNDVTPLQVLTVGLARRYLTYKIGLGKPPVAKFDNAPLKKLMERHLLSKPVTTPLYFGFMKLETGEYVRAILPDSDPGQGYLFSRLLLRAICSAHHRLTHQTG